MKTADSFKHDELSHADFVRRLATFSATTFTGFERLDCALESLPQDPASFPSLSPVRLAATGWNYEDKVVYNAAQDADALCYTLFDEKSLKKQYASVEPTLVCDHCLVSVKIPLLFEKFTPQSKTATKDNQPQVSHLDCFSDRKFYNPAQSCSSSEFRETRRAEEFGTETKSIPFTENSVSATTFSERATVSAFSSMLPELHRQDCPWAAARKTFSSASFPLAKKSSSSSSLLASVGSHARKKHRTCSFIAVRLPGMTSGVLALKDFFIKTEKLVLCLGPWLDVLEREFTKRESQAGDLKSNQCDDTSKSDLLPFANGAALAYSYLFGTRQRKSTALLEAVAAAFDFETLENEHISQFDNFRKTETVNEQKASSLNEKVDSNVQDSVVKLISACKSRQTISNRFLNFYGQTKTEMQVPELFNSVSSLVLSVSISLALLNWQPNPTTKQYLQNTVESQKNTASPLANSQNKVMGKTSDDLISNILPERNFLDESESEYEISPFKKSLIKNSSKAGDFDRLNTITVYCDYCNVNCTLNFGSKDTSLEANTGEFQLFDLNTTEYKSVDHKSNRLDDASLSNATDCRLIANKASSSNILGRLRDPFEAHQDYCQWRTEYLRRLRLAASAVLPIISKVPQGTANTDICKTPINSNCDSRRLCKNEYITDADESVLIKKGANISNSHSIRCKEPNFNSIKHPSLPKNYLDGVRERLRRSRAVAKSALQPLARASARRSFHEKDRIGRIANILNKYKNLPKKA